MPVQARVYATKAGEARHAWTCDASNTFVWIVSRSGDDRQAAERAFHESPQRRAMDPDLARRIVEPRGFRARPVDLP